MSLFTWADSYSVGVSAIDNQHKQLVVLLNELHDAMGRGGGNEAIDGILDRLVQYTKLHFADEERLMARAAYPKLASHKQIHEELTAEACRLQAAFRAGRMGISIEVLKFLRDWLQQHINGSDKEAGRYLAQQRLAS